MRENTLDGILSAMASRISECERRIANKRRTGTISEVDRDKGLYRVELSNQAGKPFLSPWMKARALSAGGVKIDVLRYVGEQVDVLSENGDLTDAVMDLSTYSNDNARENSANAPLHIKIGDAVLEMSGDGLTITAGTITLKGDVVVEGSALTHNGKNVGDTHIHPESIGILTGPPQ